MSELIAGLMIPPEVEERLGEIPALSPAERMNAEPGTLDDGVNCPVCRNKGYVARELEDGSLVTRPCRCMEQRKAKRLIGQSGLGDLLESCTLKSFQTPDEWTKRALDKAVDYCKNGRGSWFYVSGRPGTGKTHLCTGICRYLLNHGAPVRYFLWREDAPKLKALVNDAEEYERRFRDLASVPVLYIDDFLKGTVTDADLNLAFSLINARYNQKHCRTIFSSERTIRDVRSYDEAVGGRIMQRADRYILNAPHDAKDFRAAGKEEHE